MTQIMETAETPAARDAWSDPPARTSLPNAQEYEQFDYRPMPMLAPIAGVMAVCSLIAYLGLFGIGLAFVGAFVALLAMLSIKRSAGGLSGMWLAATGLVLCMTNALGGIALQVYQYNHEVPDGFERVNFTQEISTPGFELRDNAQHVPQVVKDLVDKPIFIKGFMYPTGQTEGLHAFLLLKDSGECCFGGKPALEDMVGVRMAPGSEVDYYGGRVAVAGTFKLNEEYQGESLEPVYILDGVHFSKAKTSF